jgi:hypothetical protein
VAQREERAGREVVLGGSHVGESPWFSLWLEHKKSFWWEVKRSLLGESLSHPLSTAGLDEQRQSMVSELYCRKTGGREKVERERERLAMATWREGGRERRKVRE